MKCQELILVPCLVGLLAGQVFAQAASSPTHLSLSAEQSSCVTMISTTHQLVCNLGDGIIGPRAANTTHVLEAGFVATLDVNPVGRPWITDIEPRHVTLRGGNQVITIHGSNLGGFSAVTIGGAAATTLTRQQDRMTVRMPAWNEPGFPVVAVANLGGTAQVRGPLGVLPLITADPSPAAGVAFDMVFHGSPNDVVFWAASVLSTPPIAFPPFLHRLSLHPAATLVLANFVLPSSGEVRFPVPPTNYTGTIYTQALFGTSNPGYAPGAFSNVMVLR